MPSNFFRQLSKNTPAWLIFTSLLLLPVGRTVELPTLIMSIAGMVLIWRHHATIISQPAQRLFGLLFLCIWLPMLFSLTDAVNTYKTASTVLTFPRLYLAGVFVVWTLEDQRQRDLLLRLAAILVAFWVLDALIQAVRGIDLFGFRHTASRLNGVYGESHLDLGVALPTLAPFLLVTLRQKPWLLAIGATLTGIVILLAGSRGGWVSYALIILLLLASETQRFRRNRYWGGFIVIFLIGLLTIVANVHPEARQRIQGTLGLFSGDLQIVDKALSGRLKIWETSWNIFQAHPINGVGANGFRNIYPAYAVQGDVFVNEETQTGPFYAHQLIVQVGSDTGLIGIAGLLMFYFLWLRSWRSLDQTQKAATLPFTLAAIAWLFPLNTHASFYSAQWSQLIWLLLALHCAALSRPPSTNEITR
jgi:O-antigen ligase